MYINWSNFSAQPGLVPRISSRHTRERITSATYFLDHKSSFGYIHLCILTSQEETLKSKISYDKLAGGHRFKVEAYQVDNGRFTELDFREAIAETNQIITFVE